MTLPGQRGAALTRATVVLGFVLALAGCGSAGGPTTIPGGPTNAAPGSASSDQPNASTPTVRQVNVTLSDAGCGPQTLSVPAGPTTFIVTNTGSGSVLEYEIEQSGRIIGEVENVIPGIDRTFTLNLKPGAYILNCPGGTSAATGTLTVTE
ncbi:MAG TPA: cupredoxin domain-containing protein [Candidatus Limnocylindrales bacterium]|nr:cupredoxin domain-containing protein [Candidatus Limnocylindrales bacterium]